MITKDGIDVSLDALNAENYVVPKGEEMVYHCVIEVVQFNPKTGARMSRPRIQKFGRKVFEQTVRDALLKQGYTIKVLYNPTEWIKARKNRIAAGRVNAEARRKAEIDAAVQAALAEERARQEQRELEIGKMLQEIQVKYEALAESEKEAENAALAEANDNADANADAEAKNTEPAEASNPKAKPGRPKKNTEE